ncbi:hypothetical protein RintRC_5082 [Richelia intracellularis]|nr:hypothetical protein RintRC_5082 [Richelia intracellularis]
MVILITQVKGKVKLYGLHSREAEEAGRQGVKERFVQLLSTNNYQPKYRLLNRSSS